MKPDKGILVLYTGCSGVGKGTIMKELLQRDASIRLSVSNTTRDPRKGEIDGVHYRFIDTAAFERMIGEDAFLEHAEYAGCYYGSPRKYVDEALAQGKDVILDIEVQGAAQVCEKRPDTVRIFMAPPSWGELERRLVSRGTDTPEKIRVRLARAKEEFRVADTYDYLVINDTLDKAVREMAAIMLAEHCRPAERIGLLAQ